MAPEAEEDTAEHRSDNTGGHADGTAGLEYSTVTFGDSMDIFMIEQANFAESMSIRYELAYLLINRKTCYKCTCNGRIIGFIKTDLRPDSGEAVIDTIFVSKQYRRRGIGRSLLQLSLSSIQSYDASPRLFEQVYLYVSPSNHKAIQLYTSAGFQEDELIEKAYADGSPGLKMVWKRTA